MFRSSNFDKLLDKATSNLRLDPDWPTILQICDLIRQNDCSPKYAVAAVKKKLYSQNPHQAMFALLTLESIVKNCGSGVHDEVASKGFCEMLRDLVKTTPHENLRSKILDLIQAWGFAFRNNQKYRAVQDTVNILKAEGFKFPPLKESDAMFSADTAPEWADGEVCHRCRVAFTLMVRRHHCRACGQVFCQQCSSKTSTLPKFGIEKEVRVCDACFDKVCRPPPATQNQPKLEIVDTSSDYGPTATKKRPAGGKTAEELQEEEELQLALALSQSEAEQKEKEKERRTRIHIGPDPAPHHHTISPTPSSVSASPEHSTTTNSELSRYLDRSYWEQRMNRDSAPTAPSHAANDTIEYDHQLSRYLDRSYWEQRMNRDSAPTAPSSHAANDTIEEFAKPSTAKHQEDDAEDKEIDEFVESLKSQVEIFVNRMKSNSSRGRPIANDSSVQTLFMNITAMHSRLLRYIQQQDDKRVYLESLQDKVNQVRDSRAALDTLRAEHAARLAAQAEAAERQRQMQMAAKLQAMRKKKHEYLQYQRQLALQRVQEQEREMQMRQEQQKHQYMMAANTYYIPGGVSMHQYQPGYTQPMYANQQFQPQMMPQATTDASMTLPGQPQMSQANMISPMTGISQSMPQMTNTFAMSPSGMNMSQAPGMNQPNMRPVMSQQLPIQQQMMLQQMQQMRMSAQPGMHQIVPQNMTNGMPGQNNPIVQNGPQQIQMPNQGQQPNMMVPPMTSQQQTIGQPMMIASNPMLGLQMQNMRMMSNQPNANQSVSGFPTGMQNQQSTRQLSQMNAQPPSQMTLPGQQMHQQVPMPNNVPTSQSVQLQGPQGVQNQPMTQLSQAQIPGQPNMQNQIHQPSQQMMQGQPMQHGLQQQMMSQPQLGQPSGQQSQMQMPQMSMAQMPQGPSMQQMPQQQIQQQQIPQQIQQGQQIPQQMQQGQQIPQQIQQTQQIPQQIQQGQQMPPTQQVPQNVSGQPVKMQSQNFSSPSQAQVNSTQQTGQPQVKSERNNNSNTAELISFD